MDVAPRRLRVRARADLRAAYGRRASIFVAAATDAAGVRVRLRLLRGEDKGEAVDADAEVPAPVLLAKKQRITRVRRKTSRKERPAVTAATRPTELVVVAAADAQQKPTSRKAGVTAGGNGPGIKAPVVHARIAR